LDMALPLLPLNREAYVRYGDVFDASCSNAAEANQGTARRLNWLGSLINQRPSAKLNVCVFHSQPRQVIPHFEIKLLERHLYSTQIFIPMTVPHRYLVIVALNDPNTDGPDLNTIYCFEAARGQGISYHPGIWHHPMIALDGQSDFTCLVYEDGSADDCHVVDIKPSLRVVVRPARL